MLTLKEELSQETLDAGPLIPGEPKIREVVHEAGVAGFNSPGLDRSRLAPHPCSSIGSPMSTGPFGRQGYRAPVG